jgi:hypothetical protein
MAWRRRRRRCATAAAKQQALQAQLRRRSLNKHSRAESTKPQTHLACCRESKRSGWRRTRGVWSSKLVCRARRLGVRCARPWRTCSRLVVAPRQRRQATQSIRRRRGRRLGLSCFRLHLLVVELHGGSGGGQRSMPWPSCGPAVFGLANDED